MGLSLSEADSKTYPTVNVQILTKEAFTVIYGLTATYEKILKMFSTSCLPDNGKHNITKDKKNFRA